MFLKKYLRILFHSLRPLDRREKRQLLLNISSSLSSINYQFGKLNDEIDCWKKIFIGMCKSSYGKEIASLSRLFDGFYNEKLKLLKVSENIGNILSPIAVFTQKNNLTYLKEFLPYYRKLGVNNFLVIDNNSTDGSLNYLISQNDVTLFEANYKFDGVKKAGWKLQALSYIGLNHWFIWLDSDEFIAYPQMEKINLKQYVEAMDKKGIKNVGGFMLDMYPKYKMMDESINPENFFNDYVYFDPNSDFYVFKNDELRGGMRGRVLGIYDLRLDKTPLIYCSADNIPMGNHTTFPKRNGLSNNYGCVLKHYKFLSSDAETYKKRVSDINNGYSSQEAQKKYLGFIGQSVLYEGSIVYQNSESLCAFPFLKDFLKD